MPGATGAGRLPGVWHRVVDGILSGGAGRFALFLLVFTVLVRLPVFFYPFFNGDEATYRALGNALLDGNWLYVGAVDHKPPMIYLTYAAILGLFGGYRLHDVHLVSVIVVFLTALLVTAVGGSFGLSQRRRRLAGLALVALGVLGPGKDMLAANGELFMLLPSVAAVWVFGKWRGGPGARGVCTVALAGTLVGIAALYKYQAAATLVPIAVDIALTGPVGTSRRHRVSAMLALGLGAVVPCSGVMLVWALGGHFASLGFWAWRFPLSYAGMLSGREIGLNFLTMTPQWVVPALPLLVLAVAAARSLWRSGDVTERRLALFCSSWALSALLGVFAGGRFFLHYYLQLVPPIALLAAAFTPKAPWVVRATVATVALFVGGFWVANAVDHRARPRIERYTRAYRAIGQWVVSNLAPQERILVWGNSPEIYHFSQRGMGTRFPFCNYHSGKMWGTKLDREGELHTQQGVLGAAWPMLLDDLEARRPAAIVDAAAAGLDRWRGQELYRYPKLWAIVQRDYRPVASVAGATIYHRVRP